MDIAPHRHTIINEMTRRRQRQLVMKKKNRKGKRNEND